LGLYRSKVKNISKWSCVFEEFGNDSLKQKLVNRLLGQKKIEYIDDIICLPSETLESILGISYKECEELVLYVSKQKKLFLSTVFDMTEDPSFSRKFSMGCSVIDNLLNGGLPSRGIIEVTGASGSGKTQFVLQAMKNILLPEKYGGIEGSVLYICTETYPRKRWESLIYNLQQKFPELDSNIMYQNLIFQELKNIEEFKVYISSTLIKCLNTYEYQRPIRLIAIDSITAIFRTEFSSNQISERALVLFDLAQQFKILSDDYKLPIVIINQVSENINQNIMGHLTNKRSTIPAMGLAWAYCINMRIFLEKTTKIYEQEMYDEEVSGDGEPPTKKRKLSEHPIRKMMIIFLLHIYLSIFVLLLLMTKE